MFLQDLGFIHVGSCPVKNEDCLSRTVLFSDHKFLGVFAFRSCNFLFDICTHTSPKVSLVYGNAFSLSSASLKLFRKKECESTLARAFKK